MEVRILITGKTGTGKSSTANTILGRKGFLTEQQTITTSSQDSEDNDRNILAIDTPGLFDTEETTEESIRQEIMKCFALVAPGIHALLIVIDIEHFTQDDVKTLQELKKYFGVDIVNYISIVFTGKDKIEAKGTNLDEYMKRCNASLGEMLEECSHRCLWVNNHGSKQEKEDFQKQLTSLIDKNIESNGGHCYTNEAISEAEKIMKIFDDVMDGDTEDSKKNEKAVLEEKLKQLEQSVEAAEPESKLPKEDTCDGPDSKGNMDRRVPEELANQAKYIDEDVVDGSDRKRKRKNSGELSNQVKILRGECRSSQRQIAELKNELSRLECQKRKVGREEITKSSRSEIFLKIVEVVGKILLATLGVVAMAL